MGKIKLYSLALDLGKQVGVRDGAGGAGWEEVPHFYISSIFPQ